MRTFLFTCRRDGGAHLRLGDPVPGQLHHGEVALPDRPLDVVEADADRTFGRHPLPFAHADRARSVICGAGRGCARACRRRLRCCCCSAAGAFHVQVSASGRERRRAHGDTAARLRRRSRRLCPLRAHGARPTRTAKFADQWQRRTPMTQTGRKDWTDVRGTTSMIGANFES